MKIKTTAILLLIVICLIVAIGVTGCNRSDSDVWHPGMPLDRSEIKIGIVFLDTAEGGWSLAHDTGLRKTAQELGLRDDQIIRKFNVSSDDDGMIEHVIKEAIAEGANVIITTSWGFMNTTERMASDYPNIIFAHASGYRYNDTNFTNYFGSLYQARYLSGIVAGLKTETNKIGFVAAQDISNSEVTAGLNAFALGVESVNPDASIYVSVTHSWFYPSGERRAAQNLIAVGCDVIAQHCDTAQPQITAQEAGVWGIGTNVDMSVLAPDAVLTSAVWDWSIYYIFLISSIIDGSFTTEPFFGGLADGMVGIAPLNTALVAPGTEVMVTEAKTRIIDGSLNIFGGVMETNEGLRIGTEGGVLSKEEIAAGINWYYRNIIVLN